MSTQAADAAVEVGLPLAAQEAGMTDSRMRRLVISGVLKGRLVAGRWLIQRSDLDAYIALQHESGNAS